MDIKKSIIKVFSVNFIQLVSSLIVGFIVPNILSIEGYADFKTYSLLVSYIAILHFGFIDGIYIKYGGKKLNELNKAELKSEHDFVVLSQLFITIILLVISFITNNIVILIFSVSLLPIMIKAFFTTIYQVTGSYNDYSKILYLYSFAYMAFNIFLAIILKNSNYIWYCLANCFANIISIFYFEFKFLKMFKNEKRVFDRKILVTIKTGFFVLLGNLSVVVLFGIDKWFVKFFLPTEDFAYYSFAVSMLNMVNIVINAISIIFYNYLFSNNNESKINELKDNLMVLGGFASLAYFALAFIVKTFIKKYIPSLDIIAITFAAFPYMILINSLYVNLYKVNKDEKHYFKVVVMMLIISVIYNGIAVWIFHNSISIAFATILTLFTWVIYSTHDIKKVKSSLKMYIYILGLTGIFLLSAHYLNWLAGGMVYFGTYVILTIILNKKSIIKTRNIIISILKNKLKKKNNFV